ncbi:MAG: sulfatase [Kofleriaceae bacterium]
MTRAARVRRRLAIGLGLAAAAFGIGMLARRGWESRERVAPPDAARVSEPGDAGTAVPAPGSETGATTAIPRPPDPPGRVEHVIYRLVDNRHAAHRLVDGELVVDASSAGLARYLRFAMPVARWRIGQDVGGVRAAVADRLASLELPLGGQQVAAAGQVTARVHAAAGQSISLKVNGRKASDAPKLALVDGWQTISIPVAAGRFQVGENQLALETSGRGDRIAVEWLRVGAARPVAEADPDPRGAARFDATDEAIELAKDAAVVWYVAVPEGGHLLVEVGGGCAVEVRARNSEGGFAGGLLTADQRRVDLTAWAGRVVALGLTTRDCPLARIARPRIAVHGPDPERRPAAAPPRYIVLWVMDALRADRVPTFTPGARARTPHFDELAKSSAVFRQYYVQGNESQTSHSSVWTGLYPAVHGVRLAGVGGTWRIDRKFPVIAEQLASAGFYTAAVTGNGFVNSDGGYARGFAEFRNMMRETGVINGVIYGQQIVDAVLARIDAKRAEPMYMFFGTIDTHGPWIARKPWIDQYSPGPYHGPFQQFGTAKDLGFKPGSMGCSKIPPQADIDRLVAIYDSAISYQDRELGRFVAQLKSWGIWDQTMLVVTADHGEELFEDRRCGHGQSLRDSVIRVPLLIHDPARFPGGTVIDEGAEGVDVLPTILDAVGAPAVESAQGRSLVPLAQGIGRGWATPSYTSMFEFAHAMRIGRWKVRVGRTGAPIVADLVADPEERVDLAATRPVERRMLTDHLGMFLVLRTQWNKQAWGVVTNVTAAGARALDGVSTP